MPAAWGGAPAGTTYVNQPAFEKIFQDFNAYCEYREVSISFKHEGEMLAYEMKRNLNLHESSDPAWLVGKTLDAGREETENDS